MTRTRRQRLGIALALCGLALLSLGAWSLAQLRISISRGPMLIEPFGIAVGPEGSVLVGVDASRVHVYDATGSFVQTWPLPTGGERERFRLRFEAGRAQVATEQSGRLLVFQSDGTLRSDTQDPGAFARFGPANDLAAAAASGERYSIESGGLVQIRPGPERLLVPRLRWPLSMFVGTLPVVPLLLGAGSIAIFAGLALTRRGRDDP